MIKLILGDCLEKMRDIESGSVDMILTDPPYGTMNTDGGRRLGINGWDEVINHEKLLSECNRIIRVNGALILFSQEPYTSKIITEAHKNIPFSYRLTWLKDNFANSLGVNKAPVNYTEDVCIFFKRESDVKNPAWGYTDKVRRYIGKRSLDIFLDFANKGFKKYATLDTFNSFKARRYRPLTKEVYSQLDQLYKISDMDGYIDFDSLNNINLEFKRRTKKVFNLPEGCKFKSNVLKYKKDYEGLHPTQKPVKLLEDLIRTYTNEGETVLDFTMGSGSTGCAAKALNRDFIGIELDSDYFNIAKKRIDEY